jgi:hypothetical protein
LPKVKGDTLEKTSFLTGSICGFVAGGMIGWILFQIREARVKAGHKDRSLDKFPDSAQPSMTPIGIVSSSQQAAVNVALWTLVLLLLVGAFLVAIFLFLSQE